ncbi:MAG: HAD-IB family hydrolase [Spirochaetales bacterium]|nr:HAD-IB family hydrolase [Spirochaetales bacterium]
MHRSVYTTILRILKAMHIFDVDHTITRRSTGRQYVATAIRMGVIPRRVLFSLLNVSIRYKFGRLSSSQINRDLPEVEGVSKDRLMEVAARAFEERIKEDVFPKALEFIRNLKNDGEEVAIATSSIDIIVKPLTEYLGISRVIASSMEFEDGLCTGRFINTPAFNSQKRDKMLKILESEGIPPKSCSFYSDSIYDLPLMEAVGEPVATNPDILLARHAKRMSWRVLDFS